MGRAKGIKKDDVKIDCHSVFQKKYTGTVMQGVRHYNWVCIAEFYPTPDGSLSAIELAERFIDAITE